MAAPISMISVANQAAIEYSRVKIERKEAGKRMAEAEKTRIEEWQRGLGTKFKCNPLSPALNPLDKPLPTQKALPPLPANETQNKRSRVARFFGLGKKKRVSEEEDVDFSAIFGNPISGPGKVGDDTNEHLTALPQMKDPTQPRASGETETTGTETVVEDKRWMLRKMRSQRFEKE